jgi:nitroreductase
MDLLEAIRVRHSVRSFTDKKIDVETELFLRQYAEKCNKESGLNIQLCLNEPKAFDNMLARYGRFDNCKNYIVLAGREGKDEECGYYGEKLVLKAQQLGLSSCWVGLTYNKSKVPVILSEGEKVRLVIALGYGKTSGVPHKSKDMLKLCKTDGEIPDWFKKGMEAAMSAPTAMNQQKFLMIQKGNTVTAKPLAGFYTKVDIGIVKYHFEIGAGAENFQWI